MIFNRFKLTICAAMALSLITLGQSQILINEVDSDTPTLPTNDNAEFVELYNAGGSSVDLGTGGYVLVLYNGSNDLSYQAYDLTGTIAAGGYAVFGNSGVPGVSVATWPPNTLQNGADAVALYSGTAASNFPSGTAITTTNLVDAVVYGTADADDTGLLTGLTPGQPQVNESGGTSSADDSSQRIPDGAGGALNTGSFQALTPTPNAANTAPSGPEVSLNVTAIDFGRYNADNTASPSTRLVRIRNTGVGTLNVTAFGVQAGSASQFSVVSGPTVALPAAVAAGASVELTVQFSNSDTASDQIFSGDIEYATDAAVNGSGTVPLTAEFVTIQQTVSAGDIVINELSYDPNPGTPNPIQDYNGDGTANSSQDEFLELYNTTASPINVQGWEISMTSGSPEIVDTYIIAAGVSIEANGYLVFFQGGTPTGFPAGVAHTGTPALGNSGEIVRVSDGTTVVDDVAYLGEEGKGATDAGITSDGGSIGLFPDGNMPYVEFAWDALEGPTPGSSNGAVSAVEGYQLYR